MNVFVLTDLEGISGVSTIKAVLDVQSPEHQEAVKRLMADTNVAVAAAFDAKAKKVYVSDGHGSGKNFLAGELDPRATQVLPKDLAWVAKDVDATVLIGMHAMSGTQGAFLDHTQSSVCVHHYFYNNEQIGEMMQAAVFFGYFGVPIVAMSGDEAACNEAKKIFGDDIPCACVKIAKERNIADCIPNKDAEKRIYDAVKKGIENRTQFEPIVMQLPFEVKIEFNRCDYCDNACRGRSDVERVDGFTARTIKKEIVDYYTGVLL